MSSQKTVLHLKIITKWLSSSRIVLSFVRYTVSAPINSALGKSSLLQARHSVSIYPARPSSLILLSCPPIPYRDPVVFL